VDTAALYVIPTDLRGSRGSDLVRPGSDCLPSMEQVEVPALDCRLTLGDAPGGCTEHEQPAVLDQIHGPLGTLDLGPQPSAGRTKRVLIDDFRLSGVPAERLGGREQARPASLRPGLAAAQIVDDDRQLGQRYVGPTGNVDCRSPVLGISPQLAAHDEDSPQQQEDRHAQGEEYDQAQQRVGRHG
jgi:hypothetical protein